MYQKGHPKYGGRKKGSLNQKTKNFLDLQLWYACAIEQIRSLDDAQKRLPWIMQVLSLLMSKVANLPTTPSESLENAIKAQDMMSVLEDVAPPTFSHTSETKPNADPNA